MNRNFRKSKQGIFTTQEIQLLQWENNNGESFKTTEQIEHKRVLVTMNRNFLKSKKESIFYDTRNMTNTTYGART